MERIGNEADFGHAGFYYERNQLAVALLDLADRTGIQSLREYGESIVTSTVGPDGALYIVTDEDDGELWKITPRK